MPQLSDRALRLPASPIRKLVPYADAAKARGTHIYHLNIGQPDIITPNSYWEAIVGSHPTVLAYSHSEGTQGLRDAIRDYYRRLGYEIGSKHVIVTTGASEALGFVFGACMNPGDEVLVPEPFYANYNSFSINADVKVVPITTQIEENFALPPIEAFERHISPRTKAILICNPGNPTGVVYEREALEKLRGLVLKHDLFLIADEVYREFVYTDQPHESVLGLDGLEQHAIVTDSISKRFSACGARIGCVVSRNETLMANVLKFAQARLSPPTLGQIGAEAVYHLGEDFYREVREMYHVRRDVLKAAIDAIPGAYCPDVNGAFYAMVRLPVDDSERFCRWMLESFSYKGSTVMMAPGAGFYATPGLGKQEVRIAYVLNEKSLRRAMECLAAGLEAYQSVARVENNRERIS